MDNYDLRCKIYDLDRAILDTPKRLKEVTKKCKELGKTIATLSTALEDTTEQAIMDTYKQSLDEYKTQLDKLLRQNPRAVTYITNTTMRKIYIKQLGYTPKFHHDEERPFRILQVNSPTRHKSQRIAQHEQVTQYDTKKAPQRSDYTSGLDYQWALDAYENERLNEITHKYSKMSQPKTYHESMSAPKKYTAADAWALINSLLEEQASKQPQDARTQSNPSTL